MNWKRNLDWAKSHKKLTTAAIAVLVLGLVIVSLQLKPASVQGYKISKQEYVPSLLLSGEVIPEVSAEISTLTTGVVQGILVKEGAQVEKGQLLIQLDDRQAQNAYQNAQLNLDLANLNLQQATTVTLANVKQAYVQAQLASEEYHKELERSKALAVAGAISQVEVERAERNVKNAEEKELAAKVAYEALEANGVNRAILERQREQREVELKDKKRQLEDYQIKAPFSGQLQELSVQVGELLPAASKVGILATSEKSRIRVKPDQRYTNLAAFSQEAKVWLSSDANTKWDGKVVFTKPVGDASQGSFTAEIQLKEAVPQLYPGRLVSVQLFGAAQKDALIVPSALLTELDGVLGVWLAKDSQAHFAPVQVGLQTLEGVILIAGVEEGDIVLEPADLKEGQNISVQ
ncbi:MAG: efflux RND transporter periplasmic adaptor subunit [Desulfitobacterium sp.]